MNNISIKNKLIGYFIVGILVFPFIIVMFILEKHNLIIFIISIAPVWLFYWWGNLAFYFNNADIYINETDDIIIIRTIFNEKIISINELEINDHYGRRTKYIPKYTFIFYTNHKKIKINYTLNNYNEIIKMLNLINYKYIDQFIEDVKRFEYIFDLK